MIITDIKQLREVPVGKKATLIMEFQVVKTDMNGLAPCGGCLFSNSACDYCGIHARDDGEEVKFIKI